MKMKQINTISILFCLILILNQSCQPTQHSENSSATISFQKTIVHQTFISEGVAVGDINNDGQKDIIAGPYWFEAPEWKAHELFPAKEFDPNKEWSNTFLNFATDVNTDGWMDVIRFDFPGQGVYWYENPKQTDGLWKEYLIDSTACNESPMLADLDGDGQQDLVFGRESTGEMMWFRAEKNEDTLVWVGRSISDKNAPGTQRFSHGLGAGDVNNDGRKDVIIREGWWEAPANRNQLPWTFHPAQLGEPCSQMYAYDFDSDGDKDIVSASAHAYGIWWYENTETGFISHLIDSTFSQTHGVEFQDINADGLPDLITGKRYFAHNGKDPGGMEPAVLYWFELQKGKDKKPKWIPHLIDDNSGVGLQVVLDDLNADGKLDIINANKNGVICFIQQ